MAAIDLVLEKVQAKKKGKSWKCKCPAHDDRVESLSVTETASGDVLVYCHAGCKSSDVIAAMGLKMSDLFSVPLEKQEPTYYTYTDTNGKPVYRKVRKPGKVFFLERMKDSQWVMGLNGKVPELYNVCGIAKAVKEGKPVWIVEGEKDADSLISRGVCATTNYDGAGKWKAEYTQTLKGAKVVIVADKDAKGYEHALGVLSALKPVCKVAVMEAKEGKDAYDHFAFGHSVKDFTNLGEKGLKEKLGLGERLYDPAFLVRLSDVTPEFPEFLHEPYIRLGTTNLYDARGGSGKTTTMLAYCATGSKGSTPEGDAIEPFTTLYFGKEDSAGELRAKYDEIGGDPAMFVVWDRPFSLDARGREMVRQMIGDVKPKLVVCDPIKSYLPQMRNQYDETELGPHLAAIRDEIARPLNVAWVNVRHFAKMRQGVTYDDLSEAGQGNECWRDTHRSQLVALPFPSPRYGAAIFHMKGSIMTPTAPPFGWEFSRGAFGWIGPDQIDLSWLKGYKPLGRPAGKRSEAERFLRSAMVGGIPMDRDLLVERGRAEGHSERTLYRAKESLGIKAEFTDEGPKWTLPDPFGGDDV